MAGVLVTSNVKISMRFLMTFLSVPIVHFSFVAPVRCQASFLPRLNSFSPCLTTEISDFTLLSR